MTDERRLAELEREVEAIRKEAARVAVLDERHEGVKDAIAQLRTDIEGRFDRVGKRFDKIEASQAKLIWAVVGVVMTIAASTVVLALTLASSGGSP